MAKEVITRFVSDLSGESLEETDAVSIRITKPSDPDFRPAVLDAAESEVADLISKARREQPRGRRRGK